MSVANVQRHWYRAVAILAATSIAVACGTRGQPGDSSRTDAAVRGDSIGDLTGGPRATDSTRAPTGANTRPPTGTTPTRASDTAAQRRNDGSMMNPPIHRTNPRDDDAARTDLPVGSAGQSSIDLLAEIHALAKPQGCASTADCRTLPVGRKACGGPRAYVVFCPRRTDVAKLTARIAQLERIDIELAKGTVSDCMLVTPPTVVATGGVCSGSTAGLVEVH